MRKQLVAAACVVAGALTIAGAAFGYTVITTLHGTWTAYPGQSTTYQAAVQQPIDSGNTSNWTLKSKGAIPIMFKLSSGQGPLIFESYVDNDPSTYAYSFLDWASSTSLTFAQLSTLVANYNFTVGDCQSGSLRWTVTLKDTDNVDKNLDIHYQPGADGVSHQTCASGTSGANLIQSTDNIFVTQEFNGTHSFPSSYNNYYSDVVAELGNLPVVDIALIVDSGWKDVTGDNLADPERVNLTSATVGVTNSTPYTETFTPQSASAFAPTCTLPDAYLRVTKKDALPDGDVNEVPVQTSLLDSGNKFRVVDCKYMYNLSIPSLVPKGAGTYQIEILDQNGNPIPTPGSLNGKVLIDVRG